MFGCEPKLGVQKTEMPEEVTANIYNEEQLKTALNAGLDLAEEAQTEEIDQAEEAQENPCSSNEVSLIFQLK